MILFKLLAVPISLVMAASSGGMDLDYEGSINIYTGEPYETEYDDSTDSVVNLADGGVYDRSVHSFRYSTAGSTVTSSVADTMMTTGTVSLELSEGSNALLYRDGKAAAGADLSEITAPGSYTLVASTADSDNRIMSFTILPSVTSNLGFYQMPAGFQLTELVIDSVKQDISDSSRVDLSKEGTYQLTYRCAATGIDYGMKVTIDNTPPKITLEGVEKGVARGPVKIKGLKKSDTVLLTKGGKKEGMADNKTITDPGKYKLTVSDKAGNTLEQEFEIRIYLNSQGLWFTLLLASVFIAAAVYMYTARKRLRVR